MRIEREPRTRRSSLPYIGCGCLAIFAGVLIIIAIGAFVLLAREPRLTLQIAGFEARGDTDAAFADVTPLPTIDVQNSVTVQDATVQLGQYGAQPLSPTLYDYTLTVGNSVSGGDVAVLTFTESSLMALCQQRTTVCSPNGSAYRNGRIELRPGGAVIYADVFVSQLSAWLNLGVVMQLDSTNRQMVVIGVDAGGTLYQAPPNELGRIITDIQQTGNDILRQLILEAEGERYNLSEMRIDDSTLTLVMRA
jgi:hypothetical protein